MFLRRMYFILIFFITKLFYYFQLKEPLIIVPGQIETVGLVEKSDSYVPGKKCKVAGWGSMTMYSGSLSDVLQKVKTSIMI